MVGSTARGQDYPSEYRTTSSSHKFVANQVRLELFVLAYNLGNSMRRLALPEAMKHWSLTSLQTRMIQDWRTVGAPCRKAGVSAC